MAVGQNSINAYHQGGQEGLMAEDFPPWLQLTQPRATFIRKKVENRATEILICSILQQLFTAHSCHLEILVTGLPVYKVNIL